MNKKNPQSNISWQSITQKNTRQRSWIGSNVSAKFNQKISEFQGLLQVCTFCVYWSVFPLLTTPVYYLSAVWIKVSACIHKIELNLCIIPHQRIKEFKRQNNSIFYCLKLESKSISLHFDFSPFLSRLLFTNPSIFGWHLRLKRHQKHGIWPVQFWVHTWLLDKYSRREN